MKSSSINKPPGRTPGLIHRLWRTVAKPWALALLGCLAIGTGAQAQIVLTGTSYTADFSSYAGTSESVPTGWSMTSSDFNPGGLYAGTSGTGSNYYWVYDGNRHLGIQRSGSGAWGFSVEFQNNTGSTITELDLDLDYSQIRYTNAVSFDVSGTGELGSADLSGIDFVASSSGTNGTVTGTNDTLNLTGLNIANGDTFGINWSLIDAPGADSAIGMGNFSMDFGGGPAIFTNWTGTGGGGTWQDGAAGNFGGNYANDLTNTVTFGGTGEDVATSGTPEAGSLTFSADGYDVQDSVQLGIGDVEVTNASDTATISADISGDSGSGLAKSGDGTLVLSGNNTFTGATTVEAGTLEVQSANALGTTAGGTTVDDGATLALSGNVTTAAEALTINGSGDNGAGALRNIGDDNTYAGAVTLGSNSTITSDADTLTVSGGISGAGNELTFNGAGDTTVNSTGISGTGTSVVKEGTGNVTVNAASTYDGGTTINEGGSLTAGNNTALGTGDVDVTSGTMFVIDGVNVSNNVTVDTFTTPGGPQLVAYWNFNNFDPATDTTIAADQGSGTVDLSDWDGGVEDFGGSTINALSGDPDGASLSLQGGTDEAGNGTFILISGLDLTGLTDVDVSYATQATGTGFDNNQWAYSTDGTNFTDFGGTIIPPGSFALEDVTTTGLDGQATGFLRYTLDGATNSTGNNRIDNLQINALGTGSSGPTPILGTEATSGTAEFSGIVTLDSSVELTAASGGTVEFSNVIEDGANGAQGIDKIGAGTVALSGTNTYTGETVVSAGTLLINGDNSAATGNVTVESGATLGGTGTIGGDATINGNLQPGESPGIMDFSADLTLASTANTTMEINGSGARGTDFDGIDVGVALAYDGTLTLDLGTTFGVGNYVFELFDFGSESGEFSTIDLAGNYAGSLSGNGDVWSMTDGDDTWTFTHSTGNLGLDVIPEPSTWVLIGIGFAMILWRTRRRQSMA
jgi:autotransporter-associated beta strand protein